MTEAPNMTATEIVNAKHPPVPGQAMLEDMVERALAAPWMLHREQFIRLDVQWD